MIYSNSNSERHFSGEVEKTNDIVLTDELVCEHLPYSEVKTDLQTELLFCSTLVLTELFTNPLFTNP